MDPLIVLILEKNQYNIVKFINLRLVCNELAACGAITNSERDSVLVHKKDLNGVAEFLEILAKHGNDAFHSLINTLRRSETAHHTELANILEREYDEQSAQFAYKTRMKGREERDEHDRQLSAQEDAVCSLEQDVQKMSSGTTASLEKAEKTLHAVKTKFEELESAHKDLEKQLDGEKETAKTLQVEHRQLEAELSEEKAKTKGRADRLVVLGERIKSLSKKVWGIKGAFPDPSATGVRDNQVQSTPSGKTEKDLRENFSEIKPEGPEKTDKISSMDDDPLHPSSPEMTGDHPGAKWTNVEGACQEEQSQTFGMIINNELDPEIREKNINESEEHLKAVGKDVQKERSVVEAHVNRLLRLQKSLDKEKGATKKLQVDNERLENALKEEKETVQRLQTECQEERAKVQRLDVKGLELQLQLDKQKAKSKTLTAENEKLKIALEKQKNTADDLNAQNQALQKQMDEEMARSDAQSVRIAEYEAEILSLRKALEEEKTTNAEKIAALSKDVQELKTLMAESLKPHDRVRPGTSRPVSRRAQKKSRGPIVPKNRFQ